MRELKFRVWSDFWEKYADFEAELYMDGSVDADFEDDTGIPHHESTDLIVEQYTGLKDKNGKEIYEGDILRDIDGDTATVFWRVPQAEWGIRWNINKAEDSLSHRMFWGGLKEIIGNIHKNPELLEQGNAKD